MKEHKCYYLMDDYCTMTDKSCNEGLMLSCPIYNQNTERVGYKVKVIIQKPMDEEVRLQIDLEGMIGGKR